MPIYVYACNACLKQFEKIHKMSEQCEQCPHCSSKDIRQEISSGGFILRGDGWYKPSSS